VTYYTDMMDSNWFLIKLGARNRLNAEFTREKAVKKVHKSNGNGTLLVALLGSIFDC